jgi:hypothetical protein
LQCVLAAKILTVDFVVCTLAVKKKIRAGFDMSDRTIPLSVLRTSLPELTSASGCNNRVLNPPFVSKILFSEEAGFTCDDIFNYHNCHVWCDENPHDISNVSH